MSARLTRQEMKRDRVMESIGSAVRYLWGHPKGILITLGCVAVVAGVVVLLVQLREGRVEKANALLSDAMEAIDSDTGEGAAPERRREQLQRVVDEYGSTGAAAAARLLLAADAMEAGEAERALELWNQIGERRAGLIAAEAELNLIEHLRAAGRGEEVVERLRREVERGSGALPPDALMGELAATLELLGREDEAETVREQLRERHPESPWAFPDTAPGPASLSL